jgi:hypothetical protein
LNNNANTEYTYNVLNRLTVVAHVNSLSEQIANYAYSIAADGMRTSVTEFLKMPSGISEPNETRTVDYTYDNLNRLVGEDANDSTDSYGYLISYIYDIVGNRTQRSVDCNSKNLTTTYDFNDVNDLLIKETHDGPIAAIPYENFRVYAYATDHGIRYTMAGHDGYIGRIKAFFMGLPSEWSMYLFYAALVLVPLAFLVPAIGQFTARLRGKDKRRGVLRLGLWHRCMSVMLAYMILLGPVGLHELSQGATLYENLGVNDWNGSGQDVDIHYDYDENGS